MIPHSEEFPTYSVHVCIGLHEPKGGIYIYTILLSIYLLPSQRSPYLAGTMHTRSSSCSRLPPCTICTPCAISFLMYTTIPPDPCLALQLSVSRLKQCTSKPTSERLYTFPGFNQVSNKTTKSNCVIRGWISNRDEQLLGHDA